MNRRLLRRGALLPAALLPAAFFLAVALLLPAAPLVPAAVAGSSSPTWRPVSVQFPVSAAIFPGGERAALANSQCLMCHSVGMVLSQPTQTKEQWIATINKMRTVYAAPLPSEQVPALAEYLSGLVLDPAAPGADAAASHQTQENPGIARSASPDGATIFSARCAACHQSDGAGLPGIFPPLAASAWVTGRDTTAVQILLHGVSGSLTVNGTAYDGAMPAFKDQLTDAEIAAVLTYVRTHWTNDAAPVSAELVRAQRSATQARAQPWSGDADLERLN